MNDSEILFTRQRHEADVAGLHYDYRIVIGDKAYSWATRKELPEKGKSIILHEQPVHTADYALSEKVVIPKGQYGAGVTTLDWVKKGRIKKGDDHYVISTTTGEKFLLKHIPSYGEKQWLFKQLETKPNKYLDKAAELSATEKDIAKKSLSEEEQAVKDYKTRLANTSNKTLKKALEHARSEEKDHAADFKKVLAK